MTTKQKQSNRKKAEDLVAQWMATSCHIVSEEGDAQMHWRGTVRLIIGITQLLNGEPVDLSIPMSEEVKNFLDSFPDGAS